MRALRLPLFWLTALAMLALAPALQAQPKQEREAPAAPAQLDEVGKGAHLGRQALRPGAYITPRYRKAVQSYMAKHHGPGKPCLPGLVRHAAACEPAASGPGWKIGLALPKAAGAQPLPAGLAAILPKAPPGNQYVLVAGDILLMASASRIVVDAVPHSGS
ncbi:MAG: hypothetical protein JWP65_2163 [Ramlibacter sp.]|jgi:hypothetical protein|uniref:hypothetical protein n=1 Tax=Ramlibacter sp. TaxID=1917967 RepID=UPI0026138AAE|nr:hypothetical protein [Ramlibacter sp.]MDB5751742.1 hypothetical protein [Ramlibacter sp.]